ncbi:hypothetical protein [Actinomadura rupiterrae]|uniref:hypothetical protein n=1 Tax=Actinomadura rupiterrae TaxID=559627 RepID=UPI0020A5EDC4|nr:hypothetical protein [Actinomadura rupiterrae]MCP2337900.1 hypothetical protein [Actinomadura rupiterrae]
MSIITRLRHIRRRPCTACDDRRRMWNPPVGAIPCPICRPRTAPPAWTDGALP